MNVETKSLNFELKSLSDDGTFEGLASAYDVVDLGGDIMERGAFTKTLAERPEVPIMWEHKEVIGKGALEDSAVGLVVKGRLTLAVRRAAEAHALMKDGALRGLSVGVQSVKKEFKNGVRLLREVKLWEVSLTALPMNTHALVTSVKTGRNQLSREQIESAISLLSSLIDADAGAQDATTPADSADTKHTEPAASHSAVIATRIDSMRALIPQ